MSRVPEFSSSSSLFFCLYQVKVPYIFFTWPAVVDIAGISTNTWYINIPGIATIQVIINNVMQR